VFPEGKVLIDDVYITLIISALLDSWSLVTAPLELQSTVTPSKLKMVVHGHIIKLNN
ncbi:hypothetical protein CROQUDRAFT_51850, partial [Cronartium quercuum f. sp. fusiforme G11]